MCIRAIWNQSQIPRMWTHAWPKKEIWFWFTSHVIVFALLPGRAATISWSWTGQLIVSVIFQTTMSKMLGFGHDFVTPGVMRCKWLTDYPSKWFIDSKNNPQLQPHFKLSPYFSPVCSFAWVLPLLIPFFSLTWQRFNVRILTAPREKTENRRLSKLACSPPPLPLHVTAVGPVQSASGRRSVALWLEEADTDLIAPPRTSPFESCVLF